MKPKGEPVDHPEGEQRLSFGAAEPVREDLPQDADRNEGDPWVIAAWDATRTRT